MASLTQEQIDALRSKGMDDNKIRALAQKNGYTMPSTLSNIGNALIKSEKGFGQSIAGAIGGAFPSVAGGGAVDQANQLSQQVKTNLLNTIKAKQANGEDTSRLIGALKTMDKEVNFYDILNSSTGNSLNKTRRQVIGEGLGVATDILGFGALPGGIGNAAKAASFVQGVKTGAKAGAIGGSIFGAAQGATRAMQDNKTAGRIVGAGIGGGIVGGVAGGVAGGAIGGVSGAIAGRGNTNTNKILEYVTPRADELSDTQYKKALSQGLVTPKTATSPSKYVLPKGQQEVAVKYSSIMSKDPVSTSIKISEKVGSLDESVGAFLKQNNGIFSKGELKNHLIASLDEVTDISVDEARLLSSKQGLVDRFLKSLQKNDNYSLWEARKAFDSSIDTAFRGSPTLQKELKVAFRNSIQDFVADRTPDGVYRAYMKDMSNLIRLRDNAVGIRAAKERGYDAIRLWIKNHPKTAKVGAWAALVGGVSQAPNVFD